MSVFDATHLPTVPAQLLKRLERVLRVHGTCLVPPAAVREGWFEPHAQEVCRIGYFDNTAAQTGVTGITDMAFRVDENNVLTLWVDSLPTEPVTTVHESELEGLLLLLIDYTVLA